MLYEDEDNELNLYQCNPDYILRFLQRQAQTHPDDPHYLWKYISELERTTDPSTSNIDESEFFKRTLRGLLEGYEEGISLSMHYAIKDLIRLFYPEKVINKFDKYIYIADESAEFRGDESYFNIVDLLKLY